MTPNRITHQHYFEERSVFAGGGVMGGGAKEVERGRIGCRRWKVISGRGWERAGCKVLEMRAVGGGEE